MKQTNDEKHFNFFDAASPTYMLVNSEVAEGDLGEAFPSFVKNLSLLVLAGALVGFVGLIWSNKSVSDALTTEHLGANELSLPGGQTESRKEVQ
jgi:hypothetical protein